MYYVYEYINGGYRPDERTHLEYYLLGELFLQFKKFIPNLLKNMFATKGTIETWGYYKKLEGTEDVYTWHARVMEGRWRVLTGLLGSLLPLRWDVPTDSKAFKLLSRLGLNKYSNEAYKWDELSEYQREVVVDFIVTMATIGLIMGGYLLLFAGADDDNSWRKYYRRIMENYSQSWNVYAVMKDTLSNNAWPATARQAWGLSTALSDMFIGSAYYVAGDERAFTKDGDFRGINQLQRHIVLLSAAYDINKFIENATEQDIQIRP